MKITINNNTYEISENTNILKLLEIIKVSDTTGMAIAVNNSVVPKPDWENFILKEKDKVLLIKATQGG